MGKSSGGIRNAGKNPRKNLTSEQSKEFHNAAALGLFNSAVGKSKGDENKERVKIEIQAENINEITEDILVKVFGWTSVESKKFLKLSDEEKIIYDIKKLSERDDFTGKVAKTIMDGNYKKISAKQSDILYSKGLFKYLPIFSAYDNYILEKREKDAKYRQAGSSLRR